MIEVWYRCAFGNNLFQYALGRLLAEHRGYALECSEDTQHMDVEQVDLPSVLDAFVDLPQELSGKEYDEPEERWVVGERMSWSGQYLDWDLLAADKRNLRVVLDGFFQHAALYTPHRKTLKRWFALSPRSIPTPGQNDVAVHIRRGDYWVSGSTLSTAWYTDRLKELGPDRVYVFGVGIDDETRQALAPWNPIYRDGHDIMDDFALMQRFGRIILSNSTFAWWAGFLSDAEVWHPIPVRGRWSPEDGRIDLRVHDPRWHLVPRAPVTVWRPLFPGDQPSRRSSDNPAFAALDEWLADQQDPFSLEEAAAQCGTSINGIRRHLSELLEAGIVEAGDEDRRLLARIGI